MRRDPEIIRQLLLDLEAGSDSNAFGMETILKVSTLKNEQLVSAHARLMVDAGWLMSVTDYHGSPVIGKLAISNAGYDFLDSVRDAEVWRNTKKAVDGAKGFTLEILAEIAKGIVKTQIKKLSGIEVG